jgi:radical SAM family RiPP maturation amino acid epimerase
MTEARLDDGISLLGDLTHVPADYVRDVAYTKRALERWVIDPAFREAYAADPEAALERLGVPLCREQVDPFIDPAASAALRRSGDGDTAGDQPSSMLRYWAFTQEKMAHRRRLRQEGESTNRRMAAWRRRQINRCHGELGSQHADAIVHAPASFELSKGCTVGCWFCGVAAPKFDHTWPYTAANATLWRAVLGTMRDIVGDCIGHGFLYWATDPLDNPDYEKFLVDFHDVLGRCPQTTTALGHKDIDRTRRLLRLAQSLGSPVDRFSVISVNWIERIHDAFSPEELLRVECIPQNREAASMLQVKANAGRARKFARKRGAELAPADDGATIACVSGFLFNMVERSVQLITPCNASDRWPLGYWVLDRGTFDTPEELRDLVNGMIASKMRAVLNLSDPIRLRPDVRLTVENGELHVASRGRRIAIRDQCAPDDLAALLADGSSTAEDIALDRERVAGVSMAETFALLDFIFAEGVLDEEPETSPQAGKVEIGITARRPT